MAVVFLGTTVSESWAEASFWSDRRKAREKFSRSPSNGAASPLLLASANSLGSAFGNARPVQFEPTSVSLSKEERALQLPILSGVPLSSVMVRETYVPASAPRRWVVHIQDVHAQYEAQKNIASAIDALSATHKTPRLLVGLEGAQGAFFLDAFRTFPDKETLVDVSDAFLKKNILTGAEYAALVAAHGVDLWGVEDRALYDRHVKSVVDAVGLEENFRKTLTDHSSRIRALKEKEYPADLKAWDKAYETYHSEKSSLGDYVRLIAAGERRGAFPQVEKFLDALETEQKLDFAQAERERKWLVEVLAARLSPTDLAALTQRALAFRAGRVGVGAFHEELISLAGKVGVTSKGFQEFLKYLNYVKRVEEIDRNDLLNEIDGQEKAHVSRLLKSASPRVREIQTVSRDLVMADKLLRHALTPSEWADYNKNADGFRALPDRLAQLETGRPAAASGFAETVRVLEEFYRAASDRDRVLVDNLFARMGEGSVNKPAVAVLVAGGFHSDGVTALIKQRGAAYVTLTPRFEAVDGRDALDIFRQTKTPLDRLFAGEKLNLVEGLGGAVAFLGQTGRGDQVKGGLPAAISTSSNVEADTILAWLEGLKKDLPGFTFGPLKWDNKTGCLVTFPDGRQLFAWQSETAPPDAGDSYKIKSGYVNFKPYKATIFSSMGGYVSKHRKQIYLTVLSFLPWFAHAAVDGGLATIPVLWIVAGVIILIGVVASWNFRRNPKKLSAVIGGVALALLVTFITPLKDASVRFGLSSSKGEARTSQLDSEGIVLDAQFYEKRFNDYRFDLRNAPRTLKYDNGVDLSDYDVEIVIENSSKEKIDFNVDWSDEKNKQHVTSDRKSLGVGESKTFRFTPKNYSGEKFELTNISDLYVLVYGDTQRVKIHSIRLVKRSPVVGTVLPAGKSSTLSGRETPALPESSVVVGSTGLDSVKKRSIIIPFIVVASVYLALFFVGIPDFLSFLSTFSENASPFVKIVSGTGAYLIGFLGSAILVLTTLSVAVDEVANTETPLVKKSREFLANGLEFIGITRYLRFMEKWEEKKVTAKKTNIPISRWESFGMALAHLPLSLAKTMYGFAFEKPHRLWRIIRGREVSGDMTFIEEMFFIKKKQWEGKSTIVTIGLMLALPVAAMLGILWKRWTLLIYSTWGRMVLSGALVLVLSAMGLDIGLAGIASQFNFLDLFFGADWAAQRALELSGGHGFDNVVLAAINLFSPFKIASVFILSYILAVMNIAKQAEKMARSRDPPDPKQTEETAWAVYKRKVKWLTYLPFTNNARAARAEDKPFYTFKGITRQALVSAFSMEGMYLVELEIAMVVWLGQLTNSDIVNGLIQKIEGNQGFSVLNSGQGLATALGMSAWMESLVPGGQAAQSLPADRQKSALEKAGAVLNARLANATRSEFQDLRSRVEGINAGKYQLMAAGSVYSDNDRRELAQSETRFAWAVERLKIHAGDPLAIAVLRSEGASELASLTAHARTLPKEARTVLLDFAKDPSPQHRQEVQELLEKIKQTDNINQKERVGQVALGLLILSDVTSPSAGISPPTGALSAYLDLRQHFQPLLGQPPHSPEITGKFLFDWVPLSSAFPADLEPSSVDSEQILSAPSADLPPPTDAPNTTVTTAIKATTAAGVLAAGLLAPYPLTASPALDPTAEYQITLVPRPPTFGLVGDLPEADILMGAESTHIRQFSDVSDRVRQSLVAQQERERDRAAQLMKKAASLPTKALPKVDVGVQVDSADAAGPFATVASRLTTDDYAAYVEAKRWADFTDADINRLVVERTQGAAKALLVLKAVSDARTVKDETLRNFRGIDQKGPSDARKALAVELKAAQDEVKLLRKAEREATQTAKDLLGLGVKDTLQVDDNFMEGLADSNLNVHQARIDANKAKISALAQELGTQDADQLARFFSRFLGFEVQASGFTDTENAFFPKIGVSMDVKALREARKISKEFPARVEKAAELLTLKATNNQLEVEAAQVRDNAGQQLKLARQATQTAENAVKAAEAFLSTQKEAYASFGGTPRETVSVIEAVRLREEARSRLAGLRFAEAQAETEFRFAGGTGDPSRSDAVSVPLGPDAVASLDVRGLVEGAIQQKLGFSAADIEKASSPEDWQRLLARIPPTFKVNLGFSNGGVAIGVLVGVPLWDPDAETRDEQSALAMKNAQILVKAAQNQIVEDVTAAYLNLRNAQDTRRLAVRSQEALGRLTPADASHFAYHERVARTTAGQSRLFDAEAGVLSAWRTMQEAAGVGPKEAAQTFGRLRGQTVQDPLEAIRVATEYHDPKADKLASAALKERISELGLQIAANPAQRHVIHVGAYFSPSGTPVPLVYTPQVLDVFRTILTPLTFLPRYLMNGDTEVVYSPLNRLIATQTALAQGELNLARSTRQYEQGLKKVNVVSAAEDLEWAGKQLERAEGRVQRGSVALATAQGLMAQRLVPTSEVAQYQLALVGHEANYRAAQAEHLRALKNAYFLGLDPENATREAMAFPSPEGEVTGPQSPEMLAAQAKGVDAVAAGLAYLKGGVQTFPSDAKAVLSVGTAGEESVAWRLQTALGRAADRSMQSAVAKAQDRYNRASQVYDLAKEVASIAKTNSAVARALWSNVVQPQVEQVFPSNVPDLRESKDLATDLARFEEYAARQTQQPWTDMGKALGGLPLASGSATSRTALPPTVQWNPTAVPVDLESHPDVVAESANVDAARAMADADRNARRMPRATFNIETIDSSDETSGKPVGSVRLGMTISPWGEGQAKAEAYRAQGNAAGHARSDQLRQLGLKINGLADGISEGADLLPSVNATVQESRANFLEAVSRYQSYGVSERTGHTQQIAGLELVTQAARSYQEALARATKVRGDFDRSVAQFNHAITLLGLNPGDYLQITDGTGNEPEQTLPSPQRAEPVDIPFPGFLPGSYSRPGFTFVRVFDNTLPPNHPGAELASEYRELDFETRQPTGRVIKAYYTFDAKDPSRRTTTFVDNRPDLLKDFRREIPSAVSIFSERTLRSHPRDPYLLADATIEFDPETKKWAISNIVTDRPYDVRLVDPTGRVAPDTLRRSEGRQARLERQGNSARLTLIHTETRKGEKFIVKDVPWDSWTGRFTIPGILIDFRDDKNKVSGRVVRENILKRDAVVTLPSGEKAVLKYGGEVLTVEAATYKTKTSPSRPITIYHVQDDLHRPLISVAKSLGAKLPGGDPKEDRVVTTAVTPFAARDARTLHLDSPSVLVTPASVKVGVGPHYANLYYEGNLVFTDYLTSPFPGDFYTVFAMPRGDADPTSTRHGFHGDPKTGRVISSGTEAKKIRYGEKLPSGLVEGDAEDLVIVGGLQWRDKTSLPPVAGGPVVPGQRTGSDAPVSSPAVNTPPERVPTGGSRVDDWVDGRTVRDPDGKTVMLNGVNWRGVNYGRNFGDPNRGFSRDKNWMESEMDKMVQSGVKAIRIPLLDDGEHWSGNADFRKFEDDISVFLDAAEKRGMRVTFVVLDFYAVSRGNFDMSKGATDRLRDGFLRPFLNKFGTHKALFAIDLINEPEWILGRNVPGGWGDRMRSAGKAPINYKDYRYFVETMSQAIKDPSTDDSGVVVKGRPLVTIGTSVQYLLVDTHLVATHPDIRSHLDFYDFHFYSHMGFLDNSLAKPPKDKPFFLGEYQTNSSATMSPTDYAQAVKNAGGSGIYAWNWGAKDVNPNTSMDEHSRVNNPQAQEELRKEIKRAGDILAPKAEPAKPAQRTSLDIFWDGVKYVVFLGFVRDGLEMAMNFLIPSSMAGDFDDFRATPQGLFGPGNKPVHVSGINDRILDYGHNFGDPFKGVARNREYVDHQLAEMKKAGIGMVRTLILDDGRHLGRDYPAFKADIKAYLDLAEKNGIVVEFGLFDHLAMARGTFTMTRAETEAFRARFLVPFLEDFGNHRALFSVIPGIELEWVVDPSSVPGGFGDKMVAHGRPPIQQADYVYFIKTVSDTARDNTLKDESGKPVAGHVLVGGAASFPHHQMLTHDSVKGNFDYFSFHSYPNFGSPSYWIKTLEANKLLDRPFNIGEYPTRNTTWVPAAYAAAVREHPLGFGANAWNWGFRDGVKSNIEGVAVMDEYTAPNSDELREKLSRAGKVAIGGPGLLLPDEKPPKDLWNPGRIYMGKEFIYAPQPDGTIFRVPRDWATRNPYLLADRQIKPPKDFDFSKPGAEELLSDPRYALESYRYAQKDGMLVISVQNGVDGPVVRTDFRDMAGITYTQEEGKPNSYLTIPRGMSAPSGRVQVPPGTTLDSAALRNPAHQVASFGYADPSSLPRPGYGPSGTAPGASARVERIDGVDRPVGQSYDQHRQAPDIERLAGVLTGDTYSPSFSEDRALVSMLRGEVSFQRGSLGLTYEEGSVELDLAILITDQLMADYGEALGSRMNSKMSAASLVEAKLPESRSQDERDRSARAVLLPTAVALVPRALALSAGLPSELALTPPTVRVALENNNAEDLFGALFGDVVPDSSVGAQRLEMLEGFLREVYNGSTGTVDLGYLRRLVVITEDTFSLHFSKAGDRVFTNDRLSLSAVEGALQRMPVVRGRVLEVATGIMQKAGRDPARLSDPTTPEGRSVSDAVLYYTLLGANPKNIFRYPIERIGFASSLLAPSDYVIYSKAEVSAWRARLKEGVESAVRDHPGATLSEVEALDKLVFGEAFNLMILVRRHSLTDRDTIRRMVEVLAELLEMRQELMWAARITPLQGTPRPELYPSDMQGVLSGVSALLESEGIDDLASLLQPGPQKKLVEFRKGEFPVLTRASPYRDFGFTIGSLDLSMQGLFVALQINNGGRDIVRVTVTDSNGKKYIRYLLQDKPDPAQIRTAEQSARVFYHADIVPSNNGTELLNQTMEQDPGFSPRLATQISFEILGPDGVSPPDPATTVVITGLSTRDVERENPRGSWSAKPADLTRINERPILFSQEKDGKKSFWGSVYYRVSADDSSVNWEGAKINVPIPGLRGVDLSNPVTIILVDKQGRRQIVHQNKFEGSGDETQPIVLAVEPDTNLGFDAKQVAMVEVRYTPSLAQPSALVATLATLAVAALGLFFSWFWTLWRHARRVEIERMKYEGAKARSEAAVLLSFLGAELVVWVSSVWNKLVGPVDEKKESKSQEKATYTSGTKSYQYPADVTYAQQLQGVADESAGAIRRIYDKEIDTNFETIGKVEDKEIFLPRLRKTEAWMVHVVDALPRFSNENTQTGVFWGLMSVVLILSGYSQLALWVIPLLLAWKTGGGMLNYRNGGRVLGLVFLFVAAMFFFPEFGLADRSTVGFFSGLLLFSFYVGWPLTRYLWAIRSPDGYIKKQRRLVQLLYSVTYNIKNGNPILAQLANDWLVAIEGKANTNYLSRLKESKFNLGPVGQFVIPGALKEKLNSEGGNLYLLSPLTVDELMRLEESPTKDSITQYSHALFHLYTLASVEGEAAKKAGAVRGGNEGLQEGVDKLAAKKLGGLRKALTGTIGIARQELVGVDGLLEEKRWIRSRDESLTQGGTVFQTPPLKDDLNTSLVTLENLLTTPPPTRGFLFYWSVFLGICLLVAPPIVGAISWALFGPWWGALAGTIMAGVLIALVKPTSEKMRNHMLIDPAEGREDVLVGKGRVIYNQKTGEEIHTNKLWRWFTQLGLAIVQKDLAINENPGQVTHRIHEGLDEEKPPLDVAARSAQHRHNIDVGHMATYTGFWNKLALRLKILLLIFTLAVPVVLMFTGTTYILTYGALSLTGLEWADPTAIFSRPWAPLELARQVLANAAAMSAGQLLIGSAVFVVPAAIALFGILYLVWNAPFQSKEAKEFVKKSVDKKKGTLASVAVVAVIAAGLVLGFYSPDGGAVVLQGIASDESVQWWHLFSGTSPLAAFSVGQILVQGIVILGWAITMVKFTHYRLGGFARGVNNQPVVTRRDWLNYITLLAVSLTLFLILNPGGWAVGYADVALLAKAIAGALAAFAVHTLGAMWVGHRRYSGIWVNDLLVDHETPVSERWGVTPEGSFERFGNVVMRAYTPREWHLVLLHASKGELTNSERAEVEKLLGENHRPSGFQYGEIYQSSEYLNDDRYREILATAYNQLTPQQILERMSVRGFDELKAYLISNRLATPEQVDSLNLWNVQANTPDWLLSRLGMRLSGEERDIVHQFLETSLKEKRIVYYYDFLPRKNPWIVAVAGGEEVYKLIRFMTQVRYPLNQRDMIFAGESWDADTTVRVQNGIRDGSLPPYIILAQASVRESNKRWLPSFPFTKPGANTMALSKSKGKEGVIYDAENTPLPDQELEFTLGVMASVAAVRETGVPFRTALLEEEVPAGWLTWFRRHPFIRNTAIVGGIGLAWMGVALFGGVGFLLPVLYAAAVLARVRHVALGEEARDRKVNSLLPNADFVDQVCDRYQEHFNRDENFQELHYRFDIKFGNILRRHLRHFRNHALRDLLERTNNLTDLRYLSVGYISQEIDRLYKAGQDPVRSQEISDLHNLYVILANMPNYARLAEEFINSNKSEEDKKKFIMGLFEGEYRRINESKNGQGRLDKINNALLRHKPDYENHSPFQNAVFMNNEYKAWYHRFGWHAMAAMRDAFKPLGGTTGFFNTERVEELSPEVLRAIFANDKESLEYIQHHYETMNKILTLGGWDENQVAEDFQLGFVFWRSGFNVAPFGTLTPENPAGAESEQGPMVVPRQRSRWLKGYFLGVIWIAESSRNFFDIVERKGVWGLVSFFVQALSSAILPLFALVGRIITQYWWLFFILFLDPTPYLLNGFSLFGVDFSFIAPYMRWLNVETGIFDFFRSVHQLIGKLVPDLFFWMPESWAWLHGPAVYVLIPMTFYLYYNARALYLAVNNRLAVGVLLREQDELLDGVSRHKDGDDLRDQGYLGYKTSEGYEPFTAENVNFEYLPAGRAQDEVDIYNLVRSYSQRPEEILSGLNAFADLVGNQRNGSPDMVKILLENGKGFTWSVWIFHRKCQSFFCGG
ncbi:MAG: hypothetical protein IPN19_05415 [Elusimicrobia bacterium]|nr:hypothetical protein [Elusimicrobiota bacterium]